jgi:hypothetical protein
MKQLGDGDDDNLGDGENDGRGDGCLTRNS